jgi:ABC-2 type transport system permease protein
MTAYWMPWKIAKKELLVISRKKSIIGYVIVIPLLGSIGFSFVVKSQVITPNGISSQFQLALNSLTFIFVVLAAILPASIAAYSIVGEKIEKSLEPLLATPATDGEILLGKIISAFIPPIITIWVGASIFMIATDSLTHGLLSYYYFPNWDAAIMLLILAPLASLFSIELSVIVSSRVTDVRGATQIGTLMVIPFLVAFVAGTEGIFAFNVANLLLFSAIILVIDLGLFFVSRSTFNREEILTKWK